MIGRATARRRLRTALRYARTRKLLSTATVGHDLGWPATRLPAIEQGGHGVSPQILQRLLAYYGVDAGEVDQLTGWARLARQPHWSDPYRPLYPPAFRECLSYEDDARHILCYHPRHIPGLLQTDAYARALIRATARHPVTDADLDARVRARMRRQQQVLAASRRVRIAVTERALTRPVVGHPRVMRQQLAHIDALTRTTRIGVTVIDDDYDRWRRLGAFVLLEFDSTHDADLLYREGTSTSTARLDDTARLVDRHRAAFGDLTNHHLHTRLDPRRERTP
ncbi:DUF5753 domain-containing protein [Solwaraspora sp. WMMD1047]|nr:DUF5753 domain-containing protein [Solwaraspora sp. WMMD1047]MDG4834092.1 DUF5753 domain-containing protein [Solwaraspora sp. WMMD1047]